MSAPITITGRLAADPEIKFSANGVGVAKMRVVTSRRKRQDDGTWIDVDTTWWHVTAFKTTAEQAVERLAKGDAVIIVGTIKGREWETPQGEKRTAMDVTADHIGPDLSRPRKTAAASQAGDPWAGGTTTSSDLPF